MLKKTILFFLLAVLLVISPNAILADTGKSVSYLQSQSQNAWITQALSASGVSNPDISYLDYSSTDLMTVIKNILVLSATDSQNYEKIENFISVIEQNFTDGQLGSVDLLNDDFWGLMALASVGETEHIDSIKNYILSHQNSDGGWSWSTTFSSDSNDTAAAIMALLDAGFNQSSPEIVKALDYLKSVQNEDGGLAYDVDSQSDGASSAWVISALNKAGLSASTWIIGDKNPISFLQSLEQSDGSYLWMPSDSQGSAMITAYSLVALSGKSYPVNYIDLPVEEPIVSGHKLRIEGPDNTICLASNIEANNILDLLIAGASVCNYTYTLENSAYGTYVSSIDGIEAQGMNGWQYFVDWHSGMVAAADYQLVANEEVLWAYGGWPLYPGKISVTSQRIEAGESITISSQYFDGNSWQIWPNAPLKLSESDYQTDSAGQLNLPLTSDGVYPLYANFDSEHIRSEKFFISVGSGISQTVDLLVNIESNGGGGDLVSFSVSQSSIDFGTLRAGQSAETIINLENTGNVDIYIEASILGDNVFTDYTKLSQVLWTDFNLDLATAQNKPVNVALSVPTDFATSGQKNGQLIFWAIGN
ncbi:MAG: prenyltransferase/squalene oxidase repeat-containing protein [bacterium]|nr:prenyltransferase/squalene oxidase repeat-containing protein [bacterium]